MVSLTTPERVTYSSTGKLKEVNIGVVAYGAREVAISDAFLRSRKYDVKLYIADKQRNPFNIEFATQHIVVPEGNLSNINAMVDFFGPYKDKLSFIIPGSETPIISGLRDVVEERLGIPVICPTQEYAIEASKVRQRLLTQEVAPEVNPRFRVWYPNKSRPTHHVKDEVYRWLDELECQVAVKPDKPGFGKGVGVWDDHFNSPEEVWEHFRNLYEGGAVIIEEKIEGEEFSLLCFSDGERLEPLPAVRDYKRRFNGDKGPNTGGMGHYDNFGYYLPFMEVYNEIDEAWIKAVRVTEKKFNRLKGRRHNPRLRGMPFYSAFTCTKDGIKHFEDNSRPGDPEIIGLLAKMKNDFVDVCLSMINRRLKQSFKQIINLEPAINFEKLATVGIYLVPTPYPEEDKKIRQVDLSEALRLMEIYKGNLRIYPASMKEENGKTFAGTSRTVYSLGIASTISEARKIALAGIKSIKGDDLDYRDDIASWSHIENSEEHMRRLREMENNLTKK